MTLDDWLACSDLWTLPPELSTFPNRKLHLLTAAFLRRVWNRLASHHSRAAVEATEQFADGHISADDLAWARSQAARESDETMWLAQGSHDDYNLLDPCPCCSPRDPRAIRYECRVAKQGGILDGARAGIQAPSWVAASAAFHAVGLEHPLVARSREGAAWEREWKSLFATAREILGDDDAPNPRWAEWRTPDVLAIARGIYRDRAFDQLPILADAIQDAGCDDDNVLHHCRRPGGHVRGCWVVDLAMGVAERDSLNHPALLQPQRLRHRARKFTQFVRYKQ